MTKTKQNKQINKAVVNRTKSGHIYIVDMVKHL